MLPSRSISLGALTGTFSHSENSLAQHPSSAEREGGREKGPLQWHSRWSATQRHHQPDSSFGHRMCVQSSKVNNRTRGQTDGKTEGGITWFLPLQEISESQPAAAPPSLSLSLPSILSLFPSSEKVWPMENAAWRIRLQLRSCG